MSGHRPRTSDVHQAQHAQASPTSTDIFKTQALFRHSIGLPVQQAQNVQVPLPQAHNFQAASQRSSLFPTAVPQVPLFQAPQAPQAQMQTNWFNPNMWMQNATTQSSSMDQAKLLTGYNREEWAEWLQSQQEPEQGSKRKIEKDSCTPAQRTRIGKTPGQSKQKKEKSEFKAPGMKSKSSGDPFEDHEPETANPNEEDEDAIWESDEEVPFMAISNPEDTWKETDTCFDANLCFGAKLNKRIKATDWAIKMDIANVPIMKLPLERMLYNRHKNWLLRHISEGRYTIMIGCRSLDEANLAEAIAKKARGGKGNPEKLSYFSIVKVICKKLKIEPTDWKNKRQVWAHVAELVVEYVRSLYSNNSKDNKELEELQKTLQTIKEENIKCNQTIAKMHETIQQLSDRNAELTQKLINQDDGAPRIIKEVAPQVVPQVPSAAEEPKSPPRIKPVPKRKSIIGNDLSEVVKDATPQFQRYNRPKDYERSLERTKQATFTKSMMDAVASELSLQPTERTLVAKHVACIMNHLDSGGLAPVEKEVVKKELLATAADWGADHSKLSKAKQLRPVVEAICCCAVQASRKYAGDT